MSIVNTERLRIRDMGWKKWGPYLTDRQWGTVREDYSEEGNAWDYVTHHMARSKAYRWGEEGIGGISDDKQLLCFALAFWNKKDPILKERFFGVTGSEGNHGEDVKEYYFYLDSTPTHSYMKMLYKYPQSEYPYERLVNENRNRGRLDPEFELLDSGIFENRKYFDIELEYAKNEQEDLLIKITVHNRGEDTASLNVIPTLWFRNTWAWGYDNYKPEMFVADNATIGINHKKLGNLEFYYEGKAEVCFTDNETNKKKLYNYEDEIKYFKDGINDYVVGDNKDAVNPDLRGTKAAVIYDLTIDGGKSSILNLRLTKSKLKLPFDQFQTIFDVRKQEADEFYNEIQKEIDSGDAKLVQRQALAGMMWSKQFYYFNVHQWIEGDPSQPPPPSSRKKGRNYFWQHLKNEDIISMPDKWEYPWYAAWDLAFHCIPIALIDLDFAKAQLLLLTKEWYMHPNGQLPAYEWAFGDVNPPVHPWAAYFVYALEKEFRGTADTEFLKTIFHKLLLNFTWWVNRKDLHGKDVFQGGFLGLDNIGVFDRSAPLPTGGYLEQADGTAWMAFYCQNMLMIAFELAEKDRVYEEMAVKFIQHYFRIASALAGAEGSECRMWDEEDHFFYDVLSLPYGEAKRIRIRSMVGLLPLCAATVFPPTIQEKYPALMKKVQEMLAENPELSLILTPRNSAGTALLSIMEESKLRFVLEKMLDESEFLSPYGIRSISRHHEQHPYIMHVDGVEYRVDYWPAESHSSLFGGNSNWRGPIWFPINALIIRALHNLHLYYGDSFKIECPTGSGNLMNLHEVSTELAQRLTRIFLKDGNGNRPLYGGVEIFQRDPHWQDKILFFEYFHGDNGFGLGANHQTGWSGFVAMFIQLFASEGGRRFMKKREEVMQTSLEKEEIDIV